VWIEKHDRSRGTSAVGCAMALRRNGGEKLQANPNFPAHASLHRHKGACPIAVRYGAYLRSIPPFDRFGDYVHCTGRVVNIF